MEETDKKKILAVILIVLLLLVVRSVSCNDKNDSISTNTRYDSGSQSASSVVDDDTFVAEKWNNAPSFTDVESVEAYLQKCYDKGMEKIYVISAEKPPGSGMFTSSTGMLHAKLIGWKVGYVYYAEYIIQYSVGTKILSALASGDMTSLSDRELQVYVRAEDFVDSLPTNFTDLEKEKAIHDYICEKTVYYHDDYAGSDADFRTVEGVFMSGRANCMGYSDAFCLLGGLAGLTIETDVSETHMWNIITFDDRKMLVDVTWDDLDKGWRYDYFNVGQDRMGSHDVIRGSISEDIMLKTDESYREGL